MIQAMGLVKYACGIANRDLGKLTGSGKNPLDNAQVEALLQAAREVAEGKLNGEFPIDVFQTGSGTSSNMNVNEVISNRAIEIIGGDRFESKKPVHPNDHVNMGQSTNDTFPTAIHVAVALGLRNDLIPALERFQKSLTEKAEAWDKIIKIGRTHLADATPLRLGQEFGGFARQLELSIGRAKRAVQSVLELPVGGTAVGSGINTHPEFGKRVAAALASETGIDFIEAVNHFEGNAQRDGLVECHGELRAIATTLFNVANNLRWLGSGPRCGFYEIKIPDLQPGSSIMPGKHAIELSEEERQRILDQNWTADDGIPSETPVMVPHSGPPWKKRYRLGHQSDGACVFLDSEGLCRIHAKFGEAAKPLACRIYPFAFHPAGGRLTVSLRFSCPSVVANVGKPVGDRNGELRKLARDVLPENADETQPPKLSAGESVDWNDFRRIITAIDDSLAAPGVRFPVKLLRTLHWIDLIGQSHFDSVKGARLNEFLELIRTATEAEIPDDLDAIEEPTRVGFTQLRMLTAQYARKDTFAEIAKGWKGRWQLLTAAMRFARGKGQTPVLQDAFREVPFSAIEEPFESDPDKADAIFTRMFRVKVAGLHFCGPAYFNVPLVEGFQSLALMFPAVLWLARWLAVGDSRRELTVEDIAQAISIADHHHGFSPAFGNRTFRGRVRLLAKSGDLSKLCACTWLRVAEDWRAGYELYGIAFDNKNPTVFLTVGLISGANPAASHYFAETLFAAYAATMLFLALRRTAPRAAMLAPMLLIVWSGTSATFVHGQTTESAALWCDVVAVSAAVLSARNRSRSLMAISGLFAFLAFSARIPCAIHVVAYWPIVLLSWRRNGPRETWLLAAVFAGSFLAALSVVYIHGRVDGYWEGFLDVTRHNLQYGAVDRIPVTTSLIRAAKVLAQIGIANPMMVLLVIFSATTLTSRGARILRGSRFWIAIAITWLLAAVVAAYPGGRHYYHYYHPIWAPLSLIASIGLAAFARNRITRAASRLLIRAVVVTSIGLAVVQNLYGIGKWASTRGTERDPHKPVLDATAFLKGKTNADTPVAMYVWLDNAELYWRVRRESGTYPIPQVLPNDRLEIWSQHVLQKNVPLLIVDTSFLTRETDSKTFQLLKQRLKIDFVEIKQFGTLRIFARRDSRFAKAPVGYCIYLPPGYEAKQARYPVVYYLHGGRPGSESKSVSLAKYVHRAIVNKTIPPTIYVFVNGGPVSHYNMPGQKNAQGEDVFVKELIPHVDKTYRTIADRTGRALEGFSQGGRGTARIMFKHPNLFCSAAPGGGGHATEKRISENEGRESENLKFAPGDNTWDLARKYAKSPGPPLRILVFVGTKGFNYENNLAYMKHLQSLKIPFERLIVKDAPHSARIIYQKRGDDILKFHAASFRLAGARSK
eukprot:g21920.t1